MKRINIAELPHHAFTGWLWYSDKTKPKSLENEKISAADFTDLPFIVEGMLWCEAERVSLRITCVDGEYCITQMQIPSGAKTKSYYADKNLIGGQKIKMYQHFEALPDALFPDMKVLTPTWSAFVGFE